MSTPLGIYEHYKGGRYRLVAIAKREGSLEDMAVYEPMYENPISRTFVRPLAEFIEVIAKDGYSGPRFRFVGP